jgi:ketosteroid isomerase-like protein
VGRPRGATKRRAARRDADALTALAAQVRLLADQRAIEDGVIAYAHALDSRDYRRLRDVFQPDARTKFGAAEWLEGVEAATQYVAAALDPLEMSQHRIGTIEVRLDGDRATSKAYLCAEHVRGGARFTVGGHYLDAWERTPAGWRIAERRLVTTWTEGNPAVLRGVQLGDEGA